MRIFAFLVDLLVLVLTGMLLRLFGIFGYALGVGGMNQDGPGFSVGLLCIPVGIFYFTYLTMNGSQTIGKRLTGIRVTRPDGKAAGPLRALWRSLFYVFSVFPFFFGFLLAFIVKGRSLHDFLAGTVVVKEEQ